MTSKLQDRERRVSRSPDFTWTTARDGDIRMSGYAAVFERLSLDLGGFQERIARGAFDRVLRRNPKVFLLWDHDTKRVLAGTNNNTLQLRSDAHGLHFEARVLPFSYAKDLALAMESGLVREASFSFSVAKDDWSSERNGVVTRSVIEVGELFDVTVTAMGAYSQTSAELKSALSRRGLPNRKRGNVRRTEDLEAVQRDARVRRLKALIAADEVLRQADALKHSQEPGVKVGPRRSRPRPFGLGPAPSQYLEPQRYLAWERARRAFLEADQVDRARRTLAAHRERARLFKELEGS